MQITSLSESLRKIPDAWQKALLCILIVTLLSLFIFFDTWASIEAIWERSKTYTHGYIIAPISIWLIWSKRHQLKGLNPLPYWPALIATIASGFLWLVASLINVLVVQQYAVVLMLIASYWLILGTEITKKIIFPLGFLLLMVPIGESLIPPLMEYTASFTVAMLRLTGLSVYREGMNFSLTSGNWSVVEACSGINYLIASITLGLVYAYITYTSYWKRSIFFIVSIIIPIIANGFRAYMIVMIGHLSDMKLAVGVDHILYGAVFFGIVIMLLFYVGSFWKDPQPEEALSSGIENIAPVKVHRSPQLATLLPAVLLSFIIWPFASSFLSSQQQTGTTVLQDFSSLEQQNWLLSQTPAWGWQPKFNGVVTESLNFFKKNNGVIAFYQANFGKETQGSSELVNSEHVLIRHKDPVWRLINTSSSKIKYRNNPLTVEQSIIRSRNRDIVIQRWYLIGSTHTANPYWAKWLQLLKRFSADDSPELQIILYTQADHRQHETAKKLLADFGTSLLNMND
jgi:exosortase A